MLLDVLACCCLLIGDWPQFRGPNSDAHAEPGKYATEWSDEQNVKWKVEIPGLGWSSPSVVGKRIYLTTAVPNGDGLSLRAMCYDAESGNQIWENEVFTVEKAPAIHAKNSHASPTPIVHEGSVFVHFGPQGMARLKADSGAVEWRCNELDYPPVHGNGGSPILFEGKLAVACDGSSSPFVAAIDAETGKVAWKTLRSVPARISHSFVTANVTVVDGKPQVLAPGPEHFAAYDLHTGEELWKVKAPGWSVVPQPTIGHGLVIYNHDYDNPELIAIRLGGKGDVTDSHIAWRIDKGAPSTPTPLLVGDDLYFVSDKGVATCVNAKTGEKYWTERLGDNFSASPVLVNDRILFLNENGLATWVQVGREFKTLGECEVTGRTLATPAFSNNAMYLRTDTTLYKIAK